MMVDMEILDSVKQLKEITDYAEKVILILVILCAIQTVVVLYLLFRVWWNRPRYTTLQARFGECEKFGG